MSNKKRKSSAKLKSRREPLAHSQRINLQKSDALSRLAQQAWARQQFDRAIALYDDSLRRDPTNPVLIVDLARAHGLRLHFQAAEELLERATRLAPQNTRVRCMIARSYNIIGRPEQAIEHYEQALALDPQHPETASTLTELTALYERRHRLSDARETIERALRLSPDREDALFKRALLEVRQGETTAAFSDLRHLTESGGTSRQVRSDAWYELGKLHDRAGDFDSAMHAFRVAKELLRPLAEKFRSEWKHVDQKNSQMLAQLTLNHFERWRDAGPAGEKRRLALLTGHPRSGTTLLEQMLDSHTGLVSADEYLVMSESVYLPLVRSHPLSASIPDILDGTPAPLLAGLRDRYWQETEAILDQPIGDRILLDKNPELTYLLPVIARVFPEIKVFFALRDPRDVVISCFMQRLPMNAVSLNFLSLEETAAKYAHVMNTWLRIRPLLCCAWQEVRYEEIVADVARQADRALKFLDLPWQEGVLDFHKHAQNKRVRSPTYQAVTQPVYQHAIGRWQNYAKYLEPMMETLQPYLEAFDYQ
ncbi:MAG: sulfotransferase [Pirellulales bacterium]